MSFSSWLRNRTSAHAPRGRAQGRAAAPRFRPHLEELEGRVVPSVLTVTNTNDHGGGSLRFEIAHAQNGDTVNFAPSLDGQTITLTSGELDIGTAKQPRSIQIQGPGDSQLAVSGGGASRVFAVGVGSQVLLSGLTITGGIGVHSEFGGGISNAGTLTVSGCTVSNNSAQFGGGISNAGTLTVSGCTLSGNSATDGGGIYNYGTAMITNSALFGNGNYSAAYGGGIYNGPNGTLTVSGCTVSNNDPGGIYDAGGTLTVSNTTFSGNTYPYDIAGYGVYIDGGGNTFG
jgi:hypothetical protein